MKEKIKTLLLYSEGQPSRKSFFKNTFVRGLFKTPANIVIPDVIDKGRYFGKVRRILKTRYYESVGYINDWHDEINKAPELDITECNILNLIQLYTIRRHIKQFDFIIILHSATTDCIDFLLERSHWFHDRKGKLAVFIANEYEYMGRKFRFLIESGADFICSQFTEETANWLYAEIACGQTISMPHALNHEIYHPEKHVNRSIDIGFIGARYPLWIGDTVRQEFLDDIVDRCRNADLTTDVRFKTIHRNKWASFLRRCRGIIGAESGSPYLDRRGALLKQAREYIARHPKASLDELNDAVFSCCDLEYISGKAISSRHIEPMGTKTCQLLLEGRYNDLIVPGEHYLSVKADFSNFAEIIREFCDYERRREITEKAYHHVMSAHTYRHRVKKLIDAFMEN